MCKAVDEARRKVEEGVFHVSMFQRRPFTVVFLSSKVDGVNYATTEVAKVMWPDRWDKQRGVDVAIGKATKRIARAVVSGEKLYEGFSFFSIEDAKNARA